MGRNFRDGDWNNRILRQEQLTYGELIEGNAIKVTDNCAA